MIYFFLVLSVIVGAASPLQTAANSKLRSVVGDAVAAALVSFIISTIILLAVYLLAGDYSSFSLNTLAATEWWMWSGGLWGVFFVTTILFLFKAIGSVQSIVLPIFGQIVCSMIVDHFGLLGMPQYHTTPMRLLGVVLVLIGVIFIVVIPNIKKIKSGSSRMTFLWQLFGVFLGLILTFNTVTTGRLGVVMNSPLGASVISFVIGTIALAAICLLKRNIVNVTRIFQTDVPWWIVLGGLFGAAFIAGCTFLIPIIGVGNLAVFSLFGQMVASMLIDKYGILGADKKPVSKVQIGGIFIMLIGVILNNINF